MITELRFIFGEREDGTEERALLVANSRGGGTVLTPADDTYHTVVVHLMAIESAIEDALSAGAVDIEEAECLS